MIITKTPFRMSFFGGGTDMENYFRKMAAPLSLPRLINIAMSMSDTCRDFLTTQRSFPMPERKE